MLKTIADCLSEPPTKNQLDFIREMERVEDPFRGTTKYEASDYID